MATTAEQQKINFDICIYMTFIGNRQWAKQRLTGFPSGFRKRALANYSYDRKK